MDIRCIICEANNKSFAFDKSYMTLAAMREQFKHDIVRVYLYIEVSSNVRMTLDYGKVSQDNILVYSANTWSELEFSLTMILLSHYQAIIPLPHLIYTKDNEGTTVITPFVYGGNSGASIRVIHCENTDDFEMRYGTIDNMDQDNIRSLSFMLPDVIYVNKGTTDLHNCLPIVNGFMSKPVVVDNRLYARHAASGCKVSTTKGVMLMDFSGLGGISILSLSDLTMEVEGSQVYVNTPNVDLYSKFVLPVFNGVFLYDHEVMVIGRHRMVIDLGRLNLDNTRIANLISRSDSVYNTLNYFNKAFSFEYSSIPNIENWIRDQLLSAQLTASDVEQIFNIYYSNFIVLVDNNQAKAVETEPYEFLENILKFPKYTDGLLLRKSTREVVEYTRTDYESNRTVFINHPGKRKMLPKDMNGNIAGYHDVRPDGSRYSIGNEIGLTDYVMLDFIA